MTRSSSIPSVRRLHTDAHWLQLVALSGCLLALAPGCGGGDSTGGGTSPATGGAAGSGGTAGTGGTAGSGGTAGTGGTSATGGTAGSAGTGGTEVDADVPDATGGTGGVSEDAGDAAGGGTQDADAATLCTADPDCAGNPNGAYCDPASGKCVGCKTSDPTTCAPGLVCDPVTMNCTGCADDNQCALGQVCNVVASKCVDGCTLVHGCLNAQECCANKCVDTLADQTNCGTCGNSCALPHAAPMCIAGHCMLDVCDAGFEDCNKVKADGCETPSNGSACACTPGATEPCYSGPAGTQGIGLCKAGARACEVSGTAWGACAGEVTPVAETCLTVEDDDCNGVANEGGDGCVCTPNATASCYTGAPGTRGVGICKDGTWTCNALGTAWSACTGEVLPGQETCATPVDDNCDGQVNEAGGLNCACAPSSTKPCYGGPPGTDGVGGCKAGAQTCDALGQGYGPCLGDVLPSVDVCTDAIDNDCNGTINDGVVTGAAGCVCIPSTQLDCYTGAPGTQNVGECKVGKMSCDVSGKAWGSCTGEVIPAVDDCTDALDNDCNGVVNDGFTSGGQGCVCTPGALLDCYTGPAGTVNVGECARGQQTCANDGMAWGSCVGQIVPAVDNCLDSLDNDCNGVVNDGNHTAPGCACTSGAVRCVNGLESVCSALGDWGTPTGLCNQICKVGQFSCDCNTPMKCDPGPPAKWIPVTPVVACAAVSGQKCDPLTGTCKALTITGTNTPTGTYYQYGVFTTGAVFKGGYDVDSYGDLIYVNRNPYVDVYRVTIADTDNDGKLEPNQHPNNPLEPGVMEARTLTFVQTYTRTATDLVPTSSGSITELLALSDRMYSVGPSRNGDITEYIFSSKVATVVAHPTTAIALSHMGFGDQDSAWYGSNESYRRVYSFCSSAKTWVAEFAYPDLAGSHMDGVEIIVAPSTQKQYVYVSDMTSDYIGQYRRGPNGTWVQENLFKYADVTGSSVEGMGFGALSHFWVTGGNTLIEIGGGDLSAYLP